ncbi:MAG: DUF6603 domain-containing protein [Rhizobacter sp.]
MSAQDFAVALAGALREVVRPLEEAFESSAGVSALLFDLGWVPPAGAALASALGQEFELATRLPAVVQAIDKIIGQPEPAAADVAAALGASLDLLDVVARRSSGSVPPGQSGSLGMAEFWSEFPRDLYAHLFANYLRVAHPLAYALLHLGGVIVLTKVPSGAVPERIAFTRTELRWSRLAALFSDPSAIAREDFGWGSTLNAAELFSRLQQALTALGVWSLVAPARHPLLAAYYADDNPAIEDLPLLKATLYRWHDRDGTTLDVGILALPIPPKGDLGGAPVGLLVAPQVIGAATEQIGLGGPFALTLSGGFESDAPVRLELRPAGVDFAGPVASGTDVAFSWQLSAQPRDAWVLLGTRDSSRIEVAGATLAMEVLGAPDGFEFRLRLASDLVRVVLDPAEADSFVGSQLGSDPALLEGSFAIVWSSRSGLAFEGSGQLAVTLPMRRSLGPLRIRELRLAIEAGGETARVLAGVTGSVQLGCVTATLQDVGVAISLAPRGAGVPIASFGDLQLSVGFKAPTGVGLLIDTAGVTGGGFLSHDSAQQLYGGTMELSLNERLTLKAFGIVATKMPDGRRGYSMIVFITAEGFQPIQLGMGFALLGIGGMVAINRTFDEDVLRAGLKNDTLAQLLFPHDPVGNAPATIAALGAAFPARQGSYLLGLLVRIGWFTPALVTLDLALILQFGTQRRLLVLGRIAALLPSADNDLVRLILDAMGVIDFDEGTASIDAMLVDSRLAHKFPLTGSMAMRARWTKGPGRGFVLAVGGLNPHFAQPETLPVLQRVSIALASGDNPRLVCDAYIAITDNTVQFGAHAQLHAAAYGFSIDGDIGYDVLIQLWPLHFVADFHASVQLKHGSTNLFSVTVDGELEGPRPLRVSGKATFSIFWCDFSIRLDKTLVDGEPPPLPAAIDVLDQLVQTLANPASWRAVPADGRTQGVALRRIEGSTQLMLEPLGQLEVRQQVAPLSTARDIDTFGGAPLSGARRFVLQALLDGVVQSAATPLMDGFASAQFFAMSDDEKLAAPALEEMGSGLAFGGSGAQFAAIDCVGAPLAYEQIVVDDLAAPPPPRDRPRVGLALERLQAWSATGAAAKAPLRSTGRARFRVDGASAAALLVPPSWRIVPLGDGAPAVLAGNPQTYSEHLAALASLNRGAALWQIVPAHEISS